MLNFKGPVVIASSEGGVNIEDVAAESPDKILKFPIDIIEGFKPEKALSIAQQLGFTDRAKEISQLFLNCYELFTSSDALMVEINPLAEDTNAQCTLKLHELLFCSVH